MYYFTFPKGESGLFYEIDFLFANQGKIIPLEVKSNQIKKHESIDSFGIKYSKYAGQKYLISNRDYFKERDLINLPYYLLPFIL